MPGRRRDVNAKRSDVAACLLNMACKLKFTPTCERARPGHRRRHLPLACQTHSPPSTAHCKLPGYAARLQLAGSGPVTLKPVLSSSLSLDMDPAASFSRGAYGLTTPLPQRDPGGVLNLAPSPGPGHSTTPASSFALHGQQSSENGIHPLTPSAAFSLPQSHLVTPQANQGPSQVSMHSAWPRLATMAQPDPRPWPVGMPSMSTMPSFSAPAQGLLPWQLAGSFSAPQEGPYHSPSQVGAAVIPSVPQAPYHQHPFLAHISPPSLSHSLLPFQATPLDRLNSLAPQQPQLPGPVAGHDSAFAFSPNVSGTLSSAIPRQVAHAHSAQNGPFVAASDVIRPAFEGAGPATTFASPRKPRDLSTLPSIAKSSLPYPVFPSTPQAPAPDAPPTKYAQYPRQEAAGPTPFRPEECAFTGQKSSPKAAPGASTSAEAPTTAQAPVASISDEPCVQKRDSRSFDDTRVQAIPSQDSEVPPSAAVMRGVIGDAASEPGLAPTVFGASIAYMSARSEQPQSQPANAATELEIGVTGPRGADHVARRYFTDPTADFPSMSTAVAPSTSSSIQAHPVHASLPLHTPTPSMTQSSKRKKTRHVSEHGAADTLLSSTPSGNAQIAAHIAAASEAAVVPGGTLDAEMSTHMSNPSSIGNHLGSESFPTPQSEEPEQLQVCQHRATLGALHANVQDHNPLSESTAAESISSSLGMVSDSRVMTSKGECQESVDEELDALMGAILEAEDEIPIPDMPHAHWENAFFETNSDRQVVLKVPVLARLRQLSNSGHGPSDSFQEQAPRILRILESTASTSEGVSPIRESVDVTASVSSKKRKASNAEGAEDLHDQDWITAQNDFVSASIALVRAVLAAQCIYAFMGISGLPKALLSEDLVETGLAAIKATVDGVLVPFVESMSTPASANARGIFTSIASSLPEKKAFERPSDLPPGAMSALNCTIALTRSFASCTAALSSFQGLCTSGKFTLPEPIAISVLYLLLKLIFLPEPDGKAFPSSNASSRLIGLWNAVVETTGKGEARTMSELRLSCVAFVRSLYAQYPEQRSWILEEILSSLIHIPDVRAGRKVYMLSNGLTIHPTNALLVQLIQCVDMPVADSSDCKYQGSHNEPTTSIDHDRASSDILSSMSPDLEGSEHRDRSEEPSRQTTIPSLDCAIAASATVVTFLISKYVLFCVN